jgi:hypothetical protein
MVVLDPRVVLVILAFAATYWVGEQAVKGVQVVDRKVCHLVTLGHKCRTPIPAPSPAAEGK